MEVVYFIFSAPTQISHCTIHILEKMDKSSTHGIGRVLTQDGSPSSFDSPKQQKDKKKLSMQEAIEVFINPGDMSPTTAAVFLSIAADNEVEDEDNRSSYSPNRQRLMTRHHLIDGIDVPINTKEKLKNSVAASYIKTRFSVARNAESVRSPPTSLGKRKLTFITGLSEVKVPAEKETIQEGIEGTEQKLPAAASIDNCDDKKTPKRKYISWKTTKGLEFDSLHEAQHYLNTKFPKLTSIRTKNLPKVDGKQHEFQCYLLHNKNEPGHCRGRIVDRSGHRVILQIITVADCKCIVVKNQERGLPKNIESIVEAVLSEKPNIQPREASFQVINQLSAMDDSNSHSHDARHKITRQVVDHIDYVSQSQRKKGIRPKHVQHVTDIVDIKEDFTFQLPDKCNINLSDENSVKDYGQYLHGKNLLRVVDTEGVPFSGRQAHQLLTILNGVRDKEDAAISNAEKRLYQKIAVLQEKEETNPWDKTTCFSSLALLHNLKQCSDLQFKVTASADGFDNTCSNNYIVLNFGCFSVDEHGVRSFRPFIFILCPSEKEVYFAIGVVTLLKYIRRLFGLVDFNFLGLIVSDHTPVFVNVFLIAFPKSLPGQCYPHLLRKFLIGKGK